MHVLAQFNSMTGVMQYNTFIDPSIRRFGREEGDEGKGGKGRELSSFSKFQFDSCGPP